MEYFAGIDVSLEQSSVCVVDGTGKIVREAKVASEPEALAGFFRGLETGVTRIGLEAGPLSQWLHAGLAAAGFRQCRCRCASPRWPAPWLVADPIIGR
jgi:transposase